MPRPVTLFSGQWADLTFDTFCEKAKSFGYDGVEIACWGDHFEVDKALEDDSYVQSRWDILNKHGLKCFAISTHLVGHASATIHHRRAPPASCPAGIWGDGDPEGVRQRAAEEVKNTARAAAKFGVKVVNGFTAPSHLARAGHVPAGAAQR
jgi:sugar phosphate isomerase/epimerase